MGSCVRCRATGIVRIGVALRDGTEAVMASCTSCEMRSWYRDGADVSIDEILPALASRRRRPWGAARQPLALAGAVG